MKARLRGSLEALGDAFWLRPALVVAGCVLLGEAAVWAERAGTGAAWLPEGWLYAGGEAGARALLGAVATAIMGVAGTTFSITVAGSVAALRNRPEQVRTTAWRSGGERPRCGRISPSRDGSSPPR